MCRRLQCAQLVNNSIQDGAPGILICIHMYKQIGRTVWRNLIFSRDCTQHKSTIEKGQQKQKERFDDRRSECKPQVKQLKRKKENGSIGQKCFSIQIDIISGGLRIYAHNTRYVKKTIAAKIAGQNCSFICQPQMLTIRRLISILRVVSNFRHLYYEQSILSHLFQ